MSASRFVPTRQQVSHAVIRKKLQKFGKGKPYLFPAMVVSAKKMQKSIICATSIERRHRFLPILVRKTVRYMAHDENEMCDVGDAVLLRQCMPISKRKFWRVEKILEKDPAADFLAKHPEYNTTRAERKRRERDELKEISINELLKQKAQQQISEVMKQQQESTTTEKGLASILTDAKRKEDERATASSKVSTESATASPETAQSTPTAPAGEQPKQ